MSNAKYISSILFDNSLSENSYLNDLPIIKYLAANKELKFSYNITFANGKNITMPQCECYTHCALTFFASMV